MVVNPRGRAAIEDHQRGDKVTVGVGEIGFG